MTKKNNKNDNEKENDKIKKEEQPQDEEKVRLEEKIKEDEEKYKRALADYQNLEKRVREERINWIKTANKELLLRLLPVLDTLLLAQKHSQDKNLEISAQQFLDVLKSEGIERVQTERKEFDPKLMECIITEEGEEGKVLEETRAGYLLNDQVLRPAQVKVGKES